MQQKNTKKEKTKVISTDKPATDAYKLWLIVVAILAVTFFSISPVMENSFVNQDDNLYIFENKDISKPLSEAIPYFFGPHYYSGNYVPVTMIGYALAYHASGGIEPVSYHKLSLFIHLINVLLVFWFIYMLSRKKALVAAIVALLFGIHPMHLESVAWASELKDMLYTAFFIAGLIAYHKYNEQPENAAKKASLRFPFIVFILFLLSILSKPAAIVFPFVLLLVDYYNERKFDKWVWMEKLPFFITSVIFGIIAIIAQHADHLINDYYPIGQRLLFACYAVCGYLSKFVVPAGLSNFYPYPQMVNGHLPYLYYLAPVAVIALFYGVYRTLKYARLVAFGFLFYFVNLLLVLQVLSVGNAIMSDRYTYVPYIGLLFIVAMGIDKLYNSTDQKLKNFKPVAITIIAAFALACSCITYARCDVWKDQEHVATDVLKTYPDDPFVLNNKGYILLFDGKYEEAITYLAKAIQIKPDYTMANINLADAYMALRDYNNAQKATDTALKYVPQNHNLINKKGYLLFLQHNYVEALKCYATAMSNTKEDIGTYLNIMQCYDAMHDHDNWLKTLDTALKIDPDNFILLNNKGYDLFLGGRYADAIPYYKASLESKPDYSLASTNLAICYKAMNEKSAGK